MVPPKAKVNICPNEYQESVINGLVGVHVPKQKLANLASIPTLQSTKAEAKVRLSIKTRKEKGRMAREKAKEQ